MKTGNVILAIFLWLCIPASFFIGGIFGFVGGGIGGGVMCSLGAPLILFILGLVALILGMEKSSTKNMHQVVVQKIPEKKIVKVENEVSTIEKLDDINKEKMSKLEKKAEFCHECGEPLENENKFCAKCGTKLR